MPPGTLANKFCYEEQSKNGILSKHSPRRMDGDAILEFWWTRKIVSLLEESARRLFSEEGLLKKGHCILPGSAAI